MSPRPAPVLDDSPIVPVRTTLRPSTYRAFASRAQELGVDVSMLLSRLADKAIRPRKRPSPAPRRPRRSAADWERIDPRIRELNAQGMSDTRIAKELDLSQPSVSARRRLMGIESPTRQVGSQAV